MKVPQILLDITLCLAISIVKRLIWKLHALLSSIVHEVPTCEDMFLQIDRFNVIICLQHSTKLWHVQS